MWGWLSSVVDWLADIVESIISLPIKIGEAIGGIFYDLFNWLNPFSDDFILKIFFEWITDLLKEIFVPDTEQIKSNFNDMLESVSNSFGISFDSLEEFTDTWQEKPTDDIESDYNIHGVGTLKLKFLDTTYLVQGVNKFRPIIRGFVVLLLILYNYYQVLTFIGQDPRIAHNAEQAAEKHLSRKEK